MLLCVRNLTIVTVVRSYWELSFEDSIRWSGSETQGNDGGAGAELVCDEVARNGRGSLRHGLMVMMPKQKMKIENLNKMKKGN